MFQPARSLPACFLPFDARWLAQQPHRRLPNLIPVTEKSGGPCLGRNTEAAWQSWVQTQNETGNVFPSLGNTA